jgi:mRNA-degrading endonuclease RelE of RelBE toxin-antitoxin system
VVSFIEQYVDGVDGIHCVHGVERLTGFKNFYKVRFGKYRVGMEVYDHLPSKESL